MEIIECKASPLNWQCLVIMNMNLESDIQSPVSSPATSVILGAVLSSSEPRCSIWDRGNTRGTHLWEHGWGLKECLPVLVPPGCHNNAAQTQWRKQQKCLVSQVWKLEVRDQGVGPFWGLWGRICSRSPSLLAALVCRWCLSSSFLPRLFISSSF